MKVQIEEFDWQYSNKESLGDKEFLQEIFNLLKSHKVFSVGEYHDENIDQSFLWILNHKTEIFRAFDKFRYLQNLTSAEQPSNLFEECLDRDSLLLNSLKLLVPSFAEMKKMHAGRLFAFALMPLAKAAGYTDIVLEGFDSSNPERLFEQSKDKIGYLIRMLMIMVLNFKVSGVDEVGLFKTPVNIGQGLFSAVTRIIDADQGAKVLIYNGAMHSATQPFVGKVGDFFTGGFDLSEISYANRAIVRWGDQFQPIDIFPKLPLLPTSHYREMQEQAGSGITCFTHGVGQRSYVIG